MNESRARRLRRASLGRKRLGEPVTITVPSRRSERRAKVRAVRRAPRPPEHWWRVTKREIAARRVREQPQERAA